MEKDVLEKYKKAGKIAKLVKKEATELLKPGKSLLEIAEWIDKRIIELGGKPAFPTDVSINDIAAHYCPYYEDKSVLKETDLVKIDMGVHIDGFLVDTAFTVSLAKNNKLHNGLIDAVESAVKAGVELVKPGATLSEIGKAIQNEIESRGFKPISNLSGHLVDRFIVHKNPSIPNINTGSSKKLEADWVIAIEPFASTGAGRVIEGKSCKVFELRNSNPTRQYRDVLNYIWEEYSTLPFCGRNIIKKFGLLKARLALTSLVRQKILHEYTVLVEEPGSLVAQAEHTVVVTKEGCILLT